MDYRFSDNSKFALLAINNAFTDLPSTSFQLSDGTSILPGMPSTNHLSVWKEWLGSIRLERLDRAELVILVEERSDLPWMLDDVDQRLSRDLGLLFYMLHLMDGIETSMDDGADLLNGSTIDGTPDVRQVDQMPIFFRSKGQRGSPITQRWLEDSVVLRAGAAELMTDNAEFRRVTYGLETLFKGLKEGMGQERLHQFVRSLEALVLPKRGETEKNFVHRCQTFARAGDETRHLLSEAYALRSAAEHLNPWEGALQQCYPLAEREEICWQRTRQVERLARHAYSRLLSASELREHFRTDAAIAAFWKLRDDQRRELWGSSLDITSELCDWE